MGFNFVINDLYLHQIKIVLKVKAVTIKIVWEKANVVSRDGVKVYNQDKVLCDTVKRLYPHVFLVINDVTTELLSLVEEARQLSM